MECVLGTIVIGTVKLEKNGVSETSRYLQRAEREDYRQTNLLRGRQHQSPDARQGQDVDEYVGDDVKGRVCNHHAQRMKAL